MEVRFKDGDLETLERDAHAISRHSRDVIRSFRNRLQMIRAAQDDRDFYTMKSLHFEQYRTNPGQYSMRLNRQYRLVLEFEGRSPEKTVVIVEIVDYH